MLLNNIFDRTASPISCRALTKTPWLRFIGASFFSHLFFLILQNTKGRGYRTKRLINTKQVLLNNHFIFFFFLAHPPLPLPATFYLNYHLICLPRCWHPPLDYWCSPRVAAYDNFAKKLIEVEIYSLNVNGTASFSHITPKKDHVFQSLRQLWLHQTYWQGYFRDAYRIEYFTLAIYRGNALHLSCILYSNSSRKISNSTYVRYVHGG